MFIEGIFHSQLRLNFWEYTGSNSFKFFNKYLYFQVYTLDFGDKFMVSLKSIRVMKEEFMHVPFQVRLKAIQELFFGIIVFFPGSQSLFG